MGLELKRLCNISVRTRRHQPPGREMVDLSMLWTPRRSRHDGKEDVYCGIQVGSDRECRLMKVYDNQFVALGIQILDIQYDFGVQMHTV